ncbi:MAG: winged helix-turn-helix domain-containing protein [Thermoanaerobaculia bacterium]|nr:winged helix-turn-helix domain-containing protein [Thermoanaerobaculia bacterium]
MSPLDDPNVLRFGPWRAEKSSGDLTGPAGTEHLEPKVMELLFLLAREPGQVVPRDEILAALWPDVVVGDDTLARTVSKLRRALADDAKAPRWLETIPKRGYRWLVTEGPTVAPPKTPRRRWGVALAAFGIVLLVVIAGAALRRDSTPAGNEAQELTGRANDYYFQYSLADNEAAIELFERVVARHPEHAPAHAGLANALVQRVIRWPEGSTTAAASSTRLGDALARGHHRTEKARRQLQRALRLAERAIELAPEDTASHKALGFVKSAREDFPGAIRAYRRAVELDPDAWGPLINLGDLFEISGEPAAALPYFEAAFAAMARVYPEEAARVGPWQAELGLGIADRHRGAGRLDDAERWYRRVLELAPFHAATTGRLASLLRESGRDAEAAALCTQFEVRTGAAACGDG